MSKQADELAKVMVKYGLSYARVGDMILRRPQAAIVSDLMEAEEKKRKNRPVEPDDHDELTRIQGMTPEAQDAILRLEPLAKVGT